MGAIEVCVNYSATGVVFAMQGIGNIAANIIAGFLSAPKSLIVVRGVHASWRWFVAFHAVSGM